MSESYSTSRIIQGLGESILGTNLSVMISLQEINQVTYLPLWHNIGYITATGLPLFALVSAIIRTIRAVEIWYNAEPQILHLYKEGESGQNSTSNSDGVYSSCCPLSRKKCEYMNAFLMLLSAMPEWFIGCQAILEIVATGFNASLHITPLAMGFALTSLIDVVRSIQEMYSRENKSTNEELLKECFPKSVQEILLNTLKVIGWLAIAAGSPWGWAVVVLSFVFQLCMTANECRSNLELESDGVNSPSPGRLLQPKT